MRSSSNCVCGGWSFKAYEIHDLICSWDSCVCARAALSARIVGRSISLQRPHIAAPSVGADRAAAPAVRCASSTAPPSALVGIHQVDFEKAISHMVGWHNGHGDLEYSWIAQRHERAQSRIYRNGNGTGHNRRALLVAHHYTGS